MQPNNFGLRNTLSPPGGKRTGFAIRSCALARTFSASRALSAMMDMTPPTMRTIARIAVRSVMFMLANLASYNVTQNLERTIP